MPSDWRWLGWCAWTQEVLEWAADAAAREAPHVSEDDAINEAKLMLFAMSMEWCKNE